MRWLNNFWKVFIRKGTVNVAQRGSEQMNKKDISFWLAAKILKVQQDVATYLNTKTASFSKHTILVFLICFLSLFGAYCLYLICWPIAQLLE